MSTKFTPGPWAVSPGEIDAGWPFTWGVYRPEHDTKWFGIAAVDTKENATLIAAAPELLDALRSLLDHHEDHPDHEYGNKHNCERPEAQAARALLARFAEEENSQHGL